MDIGAHEWSTAMPQKHASQTYKKLLRHILLTKGRDQSAP